MLYTQTVTAGTLDLIQRLMKDEQFKSFNLVGGTALALQLGHRVSIDIDLFSQKAFDAEKMQSHLEKNYGAIIVRTGKNSMAADIEGIRTDIMTHQYPDVKPPLTTEGVRMASLEDIAAMKGNVITRDPERLKDFVDMNYLLEKMSLNEITKAYMTKYPNVIPQMLNTSLLYHREIDMNIPIKLMSTEPFDFEKVKERLYDAVQHPQKIFAPAKELQQQQEQNKTREVKQDQLDQKPSIEDEERELQLKPRQGPRL